MAANDRFATDEDTALTITAPGVLGNDTDVDSPVLTAVVVTGPGHGALALNANGSFSYTPAAEFNRGDSLTHTAHDRVLDSDEAAGGLAVKPVEDAARGGHDRIPHDQ